MFPSSNHQPGRMRLPVPSNGRLIRILTHREVQQAFKWRDLQTAKFQKATKQSKRNKHKYPKTMENQKEQTEIPSIQNHSTLLDRLADLNPAKFTWHNFKFMFQLNFHALDAVTSTSVPSARKGAAYPQHTLMVRACNPLDRPGFSRQGFDGLVGLEKRKK